MAPVKKMTTTYVHAYKCQALVSLKSEPAQYQPFALQFWSLWTHFGSARVQSTSTQYLGKSSALIAQSIGQNTATGFVMIASYYTSSESLCQCGQ